MLLKHGRLIKPVRFQKTVFRKDYRDVGHPITATAVYSAKDADELVLLDVMATDEGRFFSPELVSGMAKECRVPLTVGGGIRSLDSMQKLLSAGADKIAINTAAFEDPALVTQAAGKFGNQCIIVSIDARRVNGHYEAFVRGGSKPTAMDPLALAKRMVDCGAGEILLTSIDREGTMEGYDLDLLRLISDNVSIPVIAHGGVGRLRHFVEGIADGHASAVAAASIFHFTDQDIIKVKTYMGQAGINVRAVV